MLRSKFWVQQHCQTRRKSSKRGDIVGLFLVMARVDGLIWRKWVVVVRRVERIELPSLEVDSLELCVMLSWQATASGKHLAAGVAVV